MQITANSTPIELWGGLECTIVRRGQRYRDQLPPDFTPELEAALSLGIKAMRYPILWERHVAEGHWATPDTHLKHLEQAQVRPIVGLVHHGSGPRYTSLASKTFAPGLARYAGAVAARYPWVEDWTPINEPVTTARFSALYAFWYPHARDEHLFWLALLNQVDATRLAMRAIREINSAARLIQTEDLGKTYATPALHDQAKFDNGRRWMGWDLLCGMVVPGHELWNHLVGFGLEKRLRTIADDPCPPDVIGINHYPTSDRFLDHRAQKYPLRYRGGNEVDDFADVEALRVLDPPPQGLDGALREAWARYRLPLAITEVQISCTREEQMRWAVEAWETAARLRAEGIDVRAVTPWALTGARDWRSLLTRNDDHYEPGAFDKSSGTIRPTALASVISALGRGEKPEHPALAGSGWWQRPLRLIYPETSDRAVESPMIGGLKGRRLLLIVGGGGTLGRALAGACHHRDLAFIPVTRAELDLADPAAIDAALDRHRPWAVVNASGWVRVDDAEDDPDGCFRINTGAAIALADACRQRGIVQANISTDLVFDGSKNGLYLEDDAPGPLNVYGASKAAAERELADTLVVRTAAFFSPHDRYNFGWAAHDALARGEVFEAPDDYSVSPTYVPDLVNAVLDLVIDDARGIWHLCNGEELSWAEFGVRLARASGLDEGRVQPFSGCPADWKATRPIRSGLGTLRGVRMPPLQEAMDRFAMQMAA